MTLDWLAQDMQGRTNGLAGERHPSIRTRALAYLATCEHGATAREVGRHLGLAPATASSALARAWWSGEVDRTLEGPAYRYTVRR